MYANVEKFLIECYFKNSVISIFTIAISGPGLLRYLPSVKINWLKFKKIKCFYFIKKCFLFIKIRSNRKCPSPLFCYTSIFILVVKKRSQQLILRTARGSVSVNMPSELGTFGIFKFFSMIKNDFFSYFIKLIWLGVGFLNRTGAEIGYSFDKNAIKSYFIIEKIQKYLKCPALYAFTSTCEGTAFTEVP